MQKPIFNKMEVGGPLWSCGGLPGNSPIFEIVNHNLEL